MKRFTEKSIVSPAILGEALKFNSGRVAQNRFLKAALTEKLSTFDPKNLAKHGVPSQKLLNLYDKWGNGHFGVVLTGNVIVDPIHLEAPGNALIFKEGDNSERREKFTQLAKNIKKTGGLAMIQLSHAGRQTPVQLLPKPFSASSIQLISKEKFFAGFGEPVELTIEQIKTEVIDRFVYAAKFAYECGFDGVELHGAHGYLLSQFTSPTTNKRTDKYGGSLENRARIIIEIYEAIRSVVPKDFIAGIKTNSVEFQSEGTTVDDAKVICKIFEDTGFDFVELSGGTYEKLAFEHLRESTKKREAFFLEFAEKIRPVFKNTIVYLTGGFRNVKAMVEAVESNATQGVGLGRPITAEPDLPKKILGGEVGSAVANYFGDSNFVISHLASAVQIEQMGRRSFEETGRNILADVSDFTDAETSGRFLAACGEHMKNAELALSKGLPFDPNMKFD